MAAVAESLLLSPSAISQQVSQLESEVGLDLIERRGRGVQLTEAGRRLVHHAEEIISVLEIARTDLAELRGTISGEVRVSAFPSIARAILPRAMAEVQRRFPAVNLIAEENEPIPALTALRGWQCDIAFFDDVSLPKGYALDRLEIFPVYEDELVVAMRPDHPLAQKTVVRLRDLAKEPWAIDTRPNTFSDFIFALCDKHGFQPNVVAHFDTNDVITAFIKQGCAITVLPRIRVSPMEIEDVVVRPLAPQLRRSIRFAVRIDDLRRPTVRAVVQVLQNTSV